MHPATALIVAAAALAVAYGVFWAAPGAVSGWPRTATKTASVAVLALAGWAASAPWLIVLGLAAGAAGDFALSRPGNRAFLAGVAAFACGHLAYAAAFVEASPLAPAGRITFAGAFTATDIAALCVLVVLLASTEVWLAPRTGALSNPVRVYVGVIGVMAAAALLPDAPGTGLLRAGAALFVASDVMLAAERFVVRAAGTRRALGLALWPAYWAGQALILAGSLPAAASGG